MLIIPAHLGLNLNAPKNPRAPDEFQSLIFEVKQVIKILTFVRIPSMQV